MSTNKLRKIKEEEEIIKSKDSTESTLKQVKTTTTSRSRKRNVKRGVDNDLFWEIVSIGALVLSFFLILSIYTPDSGGAIGNFISSIAKGLFGFGAYIMPLAIIGVSVYVLITGAKDFSMFDISVSFVLFVALISLFHVLASSEIPSYNTPWELIVDNYTNGAFFNGGLVGAIFGLFLLTLLGAPVTYLLLIAIVIISGMLITGRSFIGGVRKSQKYIKAEMAKKIKKERQAQKTKTFNHIVKNVEHSTNEEEIHIIATRGKKITRAALYPLRKNPTLKINSEDDTETEIDLDTAPSDLQEDPLTENILESESLEGDELPEEHESLCNLVFSLGKDIAGNTVVADIAKMSHLLIAGSAGSGKSVFINTLITSLICKSSPEEIKLLMIDPRVVNLSIYNGIPHLLMPVVTDPTKAPETLNWAIKEMDNRYRSFEETGDKPLPQIVIIIDELADLMMLAQNEVEESICRLAQKAHEVGIHMVIATQRPSADVITGLIKSHIHSRIAFTVSSSADSRTILDIVGAENLLGKGDMLFHPVGKSKPLRVQGSFISNEEVESIVKSSKERNEL